VEETNQRPFTAASFNQYLKENKLMGTQCTDCAALHLPPRAICPVCQSDQMIWKEFNGQGKLSAFTAVYIGPTFMNELGFDRANPYLTGVVTLDEGVKISARLLGFEEAQPAEVEIDTPLSFEVLILGEAEVAGPQLAFRAR
jgi:uncharacterized OB-fold protein